MKLRPGEWIIQCIVIVGFGLWTSTAEENPKSASEWVVFYFHRTGRCHACLSMEEWTRQVVASHARSGGGTNFRLEVVNLDEPAQAHYANDFSLTFNTVVLAEFVNGQPVRWKNLEDVWLYSAEEFAFKHYVETEIAIFTAGPSEQEATMTNDPGETHEAAAQNPRAFSLHRQLLPEPDGRGLGAASEGPCD